MFTHVRKSCFLGSLMILSALLSLFPAVAITSTASAALMASHTYTLDPDFDEGVFSNVVHSTPDQLQLDDTTTPFRFIWVAVSTKGTIVKIDTDTGAILGEYRTAPEGQPTDPSRTTVDLNGNVWNTNRAGHSVVQVGLKENGQCVDRNGNGTIETSTGLDDIRPWNNAGGVDSDGGVETAQDECILKYVLVDSWGTRHLAVTPENNVWVSGTGSRVFQLIDGATGEILRTEGPVGAGGYGGLIDANRVIWSTSPSSLLRWDTALPLTSGNYTVSYGGYNYGLCIDSQGNIWNTTYGNGTISKYSPSGVLLGIFSQGYMYAQGCVVDGNDDVWVAHSLGGSTVGHLKNDGTYVGTVQVEQGPTGVAVDALGKIWATNYYSGTVSRIDPELGPTGGDGVTPVGQVDFTSGYLGGYPYNYSDMTGSTLTAPPNSGTWTVIYDSGEPGTEWGRISWNDLVPEGAALSVTVASSEDGLTFSNPPVSVTEDVDFDVPDGRYLKISVIFNRALGGTPENPGASPILYDITVRIANQPPIVDAVGVGQYNGDEGSAISLSGATATDPDGDTLTYTWTYTVGAGVDAGAMCSFSDATVLNPTITCTDDGTFVATLTVDDGINDPVSGNANVMVANTEPVVDITAATDGALYAISTPTNLTAGFTDDGANDTHTCTIDWNVEGVLPEAATVDQAADTCTGMRTFASAGVYTVKVTVTDDDDGVGTDTVMVVVYDPSAGFVTGGGKIWSPTGAFASNPSLEGPANFGFVSKYLKGATVPIGQTEFQFQLANLNFHSKSYEWLVVTGSNYARYKGTGTINGTGNYKFMVWAGDGTGTGGADTFRIRIWTEDEFGVETVVYDNGTDQGIVGGSIIVHAKK